MLERLFITILNWSMIASYVIVGVLVVRVLLRKAPTVFSYALWGVVLVRLVTPFSFETVVGLLPQNTTPIPLDVMYAPTPEIHTGQGVIDTSLNHALEQVLPRPEYSVNPLQVITTVASWIWIAGIVMIVSYNLVGLFKLRKRLHGAEHIRDNIYRTEQIDTPFVMGVIRPKIYLVAHLTADEEAFIIQHEQYHIRRWDHLTRIVAFIALTLHWFNPLVWVAFILSDKDMECSCDEAVMHQMGVAIRADYSQTLLRLATGKKKVLQTRLAFGEGDTKKRVKNIMTYQKPMTVVCIVAVMIVVSLSIGFMSTGRDTEEDKSLNHNQMESEEAGSVLKPDVPSLEGIVTPPTTEQFAYYEVIYDYLWQEIYATFSPFYDVDRIEVSDYEERDGASYLHVTMYHTHYNRDPDTVGYIAALKEAGHKDYQKLYDEYLGEYDASFYFKAVVDANERVTLYTDVNPTSKEEWVETQLEDYVLDGGETEEAPSKSIAGYIVFSGDTLLIDTIEIVTLEDAERMEVLGLTSEDLPNGYYFNNPSYEVLELPLALEVTYDFTDSGQIYEKEAPDRRYETTEREAFYMASAYQKDLALEEQRIPYHVEIREGKVHKITETFLYTQ